jgi:iron complex transport system substrate-binding protein
VASASSAAWPQSFTDALGSSLTLAQPAQRIVALSPNLAEIVCAVGAGDQLVGVTDFVHYPPEAAAKPHVGGVINPDLEKIVALNPDLVLVSRGLDRPVVDRLRTLNFQVYASDPQSLEEVFALVEQVGAMSGHETQARQLVAGLRQRRDRVVAQAKALPARPRVMLAIDWKGLFVAGACSFAQDLLSQSGGVNVVAAMPGISPQKPWPNVTRELVVSADPQVIILAGAEAAPVGGDAAATLRLLREDKAWANLSAVRNGKVSILDADLLTLPGPRLVDGMERLVAIFAAAAKAGDQGGQPAPAGS